MAITPFEGEPSRLVGWANRWEYVTIPKMRKKAMLDESTSPRTFVAL